MPEESAATPVGAIVILVGAAIGACLALYSYFWPMTGVTGTSGAAVVIVSSVLLIFDGLVLWIERHGGIFWLALILGALGVLGTIAAAWFLHEWLLMAAMGVVVVGLLLALIRR